MYKKDAIRTYLLSLPDDSKFTVDTLAGAVNSKYDRKDITRKDVSNVIQILIKNGAIKHEKSNDSRHLIYIVIKNTLALWFAKHPIGAPRKKSSPVITRAKKRSPFIMSIDAEIAELNCKIKRLNGIRKEFA